MGEGRSKSSYWSTALASCRAAHFLLQQYNLCCVDNRHTLHRGQLIRSNCSQLHRQHCMGLYQEQVKKRQCEVDSNIVIQEGFAGSPPSRPNCLHCICHRYCSIPHQVREERYPTTACKENKVDNAFPA